MFRQVPVAEQALEAFSRPVLEAMQRKQTLGGKKKYLFEPKIPQQEAPVPEPVGSEHTAGSSCVEVPANAPADVPAILKVSAKPSCKKTTATASAAVSCSSTAPDVANDAQDMVFGRENDPKRIVPVEHRTFSFYEDTCFIMELPSLENGEFVTDGRTCALTNGTETIAMHPLAGASQLVVEMNGERITEVGTVSQTYIE